MSDVIIFEDYGWRNFLPLVYWRPVCELRCGRYPLMDRVRTDLEIKKVGLWVRDEIAPITEKRYQLLVNQPARPGTVLVNDRWLPLSANVIGQIEAAPSPGVGMVDDQVAFVRCDEVLAGKLNPRAMLNDDQLRDILKPVPQVGAKGLMLSYPWDLITYNGDMLLYDWDRGEASIDGELMPGAHVVNEENVHIGRGSVIKPGAAIDASEGPVCIGRNVTVMPNAVICGPTHIGDNTVINAGAWIRTNVSIGPGCKVGGEVGASIIHAFSNKQHYGFLGHSYVAEWVNLGAGTTTSNLKNTYGQIKVPVGGVAIDTGQTFVGAFIGDFAKTGINQTLNTGSVIGLGTSLATSTINPPFVRSFRFITDRRDETYDVQRCLKVAQRSMARRKVKMSPEEQAYFQQLPAITENCESL